jgi:hypothetical protein
MVSRNGYNAVIYGAAAGLSAWRRRVCQSQYKTPTRQPPKCARGGDVGGAGYLGVGAEELKADPDEESSARGKVYPAVTGEDSQPSVREGECVEGNNGGDAAAGAYGGEISARLDNPMEGVAKDRAAQENKEEGFATDGVFDIVAENEEEIKIAEEVQDSAMDEERG